jgi:D-alanine--poly(phosphoribitol) ligase subunit 2
MSLGERGEVAQITDSTCEAIRRFVSDTFMVEFGVEATPETDLFEAGFIDSFGFVELVIFLEQEFGVKLDEKDFNAPTIGTLAGIQAVTLQRLGDLE